ncbi:hypothetical protein AVEN_99809-1 [Araneus ventricosus]|uniref:Uncharacterized protein n=1 Tax=Araneus ventricosus TaxID=182803 RepID=A0A4Y2PGR0_ARAVE|nr:hypothetical protein AVEN_99809-1 [Araneus ventricosus]
MHLLGLERIQNATVRQIARQPWYIRNRTIRKDLRFPTIQEYSKCIAERLFQKIDASSNTALQYSVVQNPRESQKIGGANSTYLASDSLPCLNPFATTADSEAMRGRTPLREFFASLLQRKK